MVRGNNDRYLSDYGTPKAPDEWQTDSFAPLHWAVNQFSATERAALAQLPLTLRLPDAPDLLICHASARSDNDIIQAYTPEDRLQEMLPNTPQRYIVRGHNHVGQIRMWNDRFIVTCGSIGRPLDGNPTAQYVILEQTQTGLHIRHQSVPYDLDRRPAPLHRNRLHRRHRPHRPPLLQRTGHRWLPLHRLSARLQPMVQRIPPLPGRNLHPLPKHVIL